MKRFFVTLALALTMLMVIPSVCFNDAWTLQAEAATKKTIKLNKTSISIVDGKTYTLVLKNATASKVKWTTSNKNIATVSKKGVVTAKKPGEVTITAKYNGKQYKCKVTVKQPKLNKSSVSIVDGKTYTLKLKNAIADEIKWTSSDKTIATVSKTGVVTAKNPGKVTITAKYKGKQYKCSVTVTKPTYKFVFETYYPTTIKDPDWSANYSRGTYWTVNIEKATGTAFKVNGKYYTVKINVTASAATYNTFYKDTVSFIVSIKDKNGDVVSAGLLSIPAPSNSATYSAGNEEKNIPPGTYYVEIYALKY